MSKFVGFIVGTALVVVGVLTGNPALIVQGGAMIVSNAVLLLTQPKTPARQASEMALALGEQPRVLLVGETFTAGSYVDGANYGGKYGTDWECLLIRLADHKCEGLTAFYVNDEYVPYAGNGNYPQFDSNHFELYFRADTSTEPLPSIVTDHFPGWTSADVGESGCDVLVCYRADKPDAKHPAWPGGRPRFGFIVKGALCYDPRKDDTVAGGSGAHRIDDSDTWEWSENAAICRYKWVRGVYANDDSSDQGNLLIGRGLTAEEAPPENIIAAANLCDEAAPGAFPFRLIGADLGFVDFSPDHTRAVFASGTSFQIWHVPTLTLISSGSGIDANAATGAVQPDGSFYVGNYDDTYTALVSRSGAVTILADAIGGGEVWSIAGGIWGTSALAHSDIRQLVGDTIVTTDLSFHPSHTFNDIEGNSYAIGGVPTDLSTYDTGIGICTLPDCDETIISVSTSGTCAAMDNGDGGFFVMQGNNAYIIDKETLTVTAGPVNLSASVGGSAAPFKGVLPGDATIWIGFDQYSTRDISLIQSVDSGDWTTTGTEGVYFDRINNALWGRNALVEDETTVRFLVGAGYRVAGPIYANQDWIDVEGMFAAATGGTVVTRGGSVELNPGHAESVVATFTDDDLLVGSSVAWNQGFLSESSQEWVNTVVARYVEPSQKWNDHAAPVLRDNDDILADGKPREQSITLRLVRYQDQALRVAEIQRRLGRLWGRATVTLGPRFCEIEDGDWVEWTSARYGFTKTFRVEAYSINEKWQNTLTLREIATSVYSIPEGGFPSDNSTPTYTPPPPDVGEPDSGDWTLTPGTQDSAGASVPVLVVDGAVPDDENVEAIIVEYWIDDGVLDPVGDPDSIPWVMVGRYSPGTEKIEITGLTGGSTYYVALTYVVSGIPGDRLVMGPETVTDLDVSGQIPGFELTIDTVTGTTYQIAASDGWHHKRFTNAGAVTVTVPTNATAAYPIGGRTRITDVNGTVTLSPAGGVTLNSRDSALTGAGAMAVFEIEKVGTDEWDVLGDLAA